MWAFYAIWVVSLIAVSFAVERFLGLRRSKILPTDLAAGLRALTSRKGEFDLRHAQRLCKQYPSSAASVVKAMLAKVGRPLPEIEQAMTEALEHEATRLYANVRVQNLAFNVAPMLGLAGTVHGMILCFYTTAHMPVGAEQDGRPRDRHLRGPDLHARRAGRGHSGRHSRALFRRPDPQDVPAGRGSGPLASAAHSNASRAVRGSWPSATSNLWPPRSSRCPATTRSMTTMAPTPSGP